MQFNRITKLGYTKDERITRALRGYFRLLMPNYGLLDLCIGSIFFEQVTANIARAYEHAAENNDGHYGLAGQCVPIQAGENLNQQ